MKHTFHVVLTNLLVGLILLILIEATVRLFYPEIRLPGTEKTLIKESAYGTTRGLMPGAKGKSLGINKEVNEEGFWKYEGNSGNEKDQILLLGDSVTMGIGVESDSTFAGFLAREIDETTILNPSLIGYSSSDYEHIVIDLVKDDRFNISQVIIFWCLNDVYGKDVSKDAPGFHSENLISETIRFFRNNFKFYHLLKKITTDRPKSYFLYDSQFYQAKNKAFRNAVKNLERISSLLAIKNISFQVVLLPYEYQLRDNSQRLFVPQELLKEALKADNIPVFDLGRYLVQSDQPAKFYLYGDGIHFSEIGHKKISEVLMDENKAFSGK